MRLFTAVDLPSEVRDRLSALIRTLRPSADIKWSPTANLHITAKFIGDWPSERLAELKSALATLTRREPVRIAIRGIGWFPNPHHPRVLFAGIEAEPGLKELAEETDAALAPLGVTREERPFAPHLTLARVKGPADLRQLRQAIAALPGAEFGEFEARSFYLYESDFSRYTKLAEYAF